MHENDKLPSGPISEDWLKAVGFMWHQLERQPHKHWILWLGCCLNQDNKAAAFDDLGIELSQGDNEGSWWYCWLRADYAGRYSRFIHIRHLRTRQELIRMIEGVTGQTWNPENNHGGSMRTPEQMVWIRCEHERLDRRWLSERPKWREIEEDDTHGRALPEHLQAYTKREPG